MIRCHRDAISPMASSQEIGSHRSASPLGPTRRSGVMSRSGWYTKSRYGRTLAHSQPRVMGWPGSPLKLTARPSRTSVMVAHVSGQLWVQVPFTTLVPEVTSCIGRVTRFMSFPSIGGPARSRPLLLLARYGARRDYASEIGAHLGVGGACFAAADCPYSGWPIRLRRCCVTRLAPRG